MATIAQDKLLLSLLDGMSLTDEEKLDLMVDYVNPLDWLIHRNKIDPVATLEMCEQLLEIMIHEPRRYSSCFGLFMEKEKRDYLANKMIEFLKDEEYLSNEDK